MSGAETLGEAATGGLVPGARTADAAADGRRAIDPVRENSKWEHEG